MQKHLFCVGEKPTRLSATLKRTVLTFFMILAVSVLHAETKKMSNANDNLSATIAEQGKKITGTVLDETGVPLIGVSIYVAGTTKATVTDIDGHFVLQDVPEGGSLQVSYIGYSTQNIVIGTVSEIKIILKEDNLRLDEVVVVGYGTFKKRDLTGAITQVKGDDIAHLPLRSASDALQGKAAGVTVTSTSGSPGSMGTVRIRGIGTVNNNDPLYVVDGLPQTNIGWLNPSDISNMEVLKDASAQAIYGSRAANGVILITTKKGTKSDGKTDIEFDMNIGFQNIPKRPHLLDAEGFIKFKNLAYSNANKGLMEDFSTPAKIDQILNFLEKNGSGKGTDWWKEITRSTVDAPIHNYNLSFTGGNEKTSYRTSFNYMGQDGTIKGSDYKRISGRVNLDTEVKSWLTLSTNLAVIYEERRNVVENDAFTGTVFSTMSADPITPVYRNNLKDIPDFLESRIMNGYDVSNPWSRYTGVVYSNKPNVVSQVDRQSLGKWTGTVSKANVAGNFKILPFLTFRSSISLDIARGKSANFAPRYFLDSDEQNSVASASRSISETDYYVFDNYATFDKAFDKHAVNVMVGTSAEKSRYESVGASKQGMVTNDPSLQIIDAGTDNPGASGYHSIKTMNSYFGRVFYSYDKRYLLTLNYRRDGSSNFAQGNRWGNFPSLSAGWNFSEEKFMKDQSWLTQGKFRAAWGEIGNENIDAGSYRNNYGNKDYWLFGSGVPSLSGGRSYVGNPDLKWETTRQLDFGLDLAFLNGDLRASIDYYKKDTKDMLLQIPISSLVGLPNTPWVNIGSVENKGFELTLEYNGKVGQDFSYSFSGNISTYRNKVKDMGRDNVRMIGKDGIHWGSKTYTMTEAGMPIGYFIGMKTDGIFQTKEEVDNYIQNGKVVMPNAQPGDLKFVDLNGDGELDDKDRTKIGTPHPDFTYGVTLGAQYKGFDFSAFFQGVAGNDILNIMKLDLYQSTGWYNAPSDIFDKAWHGPGTSNEFFRINADTRMNHEVSDWTVEGGSYLRLKNLTLGYTLPNKITQKLTLRNVRFFVASQNLFTVTGYSGLDPEIGNTNPRVMGIDQGWYPQARVFMFGVSFKL